MGEALQELGVTVLTGVQVEGWSCGEGGRVKGVELSGTGGESITQECKVRETMIQAFTTSSVQCIACFCVKATK